MDEDHAELSNNHQGNRLLANRQKHFSSILMTHYFQIKTLYTKHTFSQVRREESNVLEFEIDELDDDQVNNELSGEAGYAPEDNEFNEDNPIANDGE